MKINCLIVDDEPIARDVLESYVHKIEVLNLVASCKSALEAFNWMQKQSIDLLFLDIQMPNLTGIDFLKTMKPDAAVIFTTAHRDFAVEGYELEVLDYLLKPITFKRTLQAVNRYLKINRHQPYTFQEPKSASDPAESGFMFLKENKKMVKVYFNDILYVQSLKDYSRIFTENQRIVTAKNLLYFENRLPQNQFARIHKSYLVALSKVKAYSNSSVEINENSLPLGRTYKQRFIQLINKEEIV